MVNLFNKIVVITGAGSGIGQAVALSFLKEGAVTCLLGRRKNKLIETKNIAKKKCYIGKAILFSCDVTDEKKIKTLFKSIKKDLKRIDFLFNNAGIALSFTAFDEIMYKDWKKVIDTNVNGMFLCAKYAYQIMKNQKPKGGRIINNGSISAYSPRLGSAAYTASKHAVTGLTKSISLDGRKDKVVCSQIDIGNAYTSLTKSFSKGTIQASGYVIAEPTINVNDVAKTVISICTLPLDTNIISTIIIANNMPFVGRG